MGYLPLKTCHCGRGTHIIQVISFSKEHTCSWSLICTAWGLYGDDDELGTLNRLTNDKVLAAAREEIQTGERISLNWPLDAQGSEKSFFNRKSFHQEMFQKLPRIVNDDVWAFNTQVSSQWDGERTSLYVFNTNEQFTDALDMNLNWRLACYKTCPT